VKLLVVEANAIIDIDYTGSQILLRTVAELVATDIIVALARLSDERAQAQARRTGLIEAIGPDHVFMSVEDAVRKLGPDVASHPGIYSHASPVSVPERRGGDRD
jgi:MFS superfamily sulfate permease-like transporter